MNLLHKCRSLGFAVIIVLIPSKAVSAAEIAVTLPPLAGLISMLDKKADVLCLLGNASDPHHFQLTPRKIEALQRTSLLIRSSKDDASWPLPAHHAHTLDLWPDTDHGWLNPAKVRAILPLIANTLTELQPQRATAIAIALQTALNDTHEIEAAWQQALTANQQAGVLMQHPAWQRLMRSMNIPVLDVLESGQHGHEHGPRQLEHALSTLNKHPKAWLIADHGHSSRALDWLQSHADHQPIRISLNALGSCSQSWPTLMRQNIKKITDQSAL